MQKLRNWTYHKLRCSERFTKTDMVYVAKGSFWMTFGQVTSSIFSLILVVAFANLLPRETYGMYRYILSLVGVLGIFTLNGMNNAVAQAVAVGNDGALRTSVRYQTKWNVLMLLATWVLSGYYMYKGDELLAICFFILGIFVPVTLALNTYGSYLEGKRDFKLAGIASAVSGFIYMLGMIGVILWRGEVVWIVAAYAVTTFLSTLVFYLYTLHKFNPPVVESSEVLRYGRNLTFIGFISPIASQIDKILLTHFWGPAQLAVYALALAVPERAISFIKSWVGIGFPKFSAKTPQELNQMFYKRIFQGISIGALVAAIYIVLAPILFRYVLPQYLDAVLYSQILAISFTFAMPNRYISLLLVSQKYSKPIFVNSIIQNVLKIGLFSVFGIFGGILGLVWANVAHNFLGMIVNIAVWRVASRV